MSGTDVFSQRMELEHDFLLAFLTGLARRKCQPDDAFAICPPEMLGEGGIPHAVYAATQALHKRGEWPTLHGIYAHLVATGVKHVTAADIAHLCEGIYCHEEHVKLLAQKVRAEGLKRKAEGEFAALVQESLRYGTDPVELAPRLRALADTFEGGVQDGGEIADVMERLMQNVANGTAAAPVPTPWHSVNRALKGGIVPGELCVLAARPGIGKTAFAGNLAVEVARTGKSVLFVSREVTAETIGARMLSREARIDNRVFRQGIGNAHNLLPAMRSAADVIASLPLRIVEKSTVPMTPTEIRRQARGTKDIGLVVVDYLQLVTPDQKHNSREREVAEMSRSFKQLALDCRCPVLLLSQLNRAAEEKDQCPGLHNLRESGAIEQDADIVMFLHTRKANLSMTKAPVRVEVAKGRSSGTGTAYLTFDKPFADFTVDENAESWRQQTRRDRADDL